MEKLNSLEADKQRLSSEVGIAQRQILDEKGSIRLDFSTSIKKHI